MEFANLHASISYNAKDLVPKNDVFVEGDEVKSADDEILRRIWDEYPGGFLDLQEDLLDLSDSSSPSAQIQNDGQGEDAEDEPTQGMSWEGMKRLREAIGSQLNDARNELWFALELSKSLVATSATGLSSKDASKHAQDANGAGVITGGTPQPSQPNPNDAIFPAGTFSTSAFEPLPNPESVTMERTEAAVASRLATLDQCELMIDNAIEELTRQSVAGEEFMKNLQTLRGADGVNGIESGLWTVLPRPDFEKAGRSSDLVRDVVVPYALDEANPSTRAACLAAFDLDPDKAGVLTYGARRHRRLQVNIVDGFLNTRVSGMDKPQISTTPHDIVRDLEQAQVEALDEMLYSELREEVVRRQLGSIYADVVLVSLSEQELRFSMVDTDSLALDGDLDCNTVIAACRWSFLNVIRDRKQRILSTSIRPSSILAPILQILQYRHSLDQASTTLESFKTTCQAADLAASVTYTPAMTEDSVYGMLGGERDLSAGGGILTVELHDSPGASIDLSPDGAMLLTTSQGTFPVARPSDLPYLLSEDIGRQILAIVLHGLERRLVRMTDSRLSFLDEMEDGIAMQAGGLVKANFSFEGDRLDVSWQGCPRTVKDYTSSRGTSLQSWIDGVADIAVDLSRSGKGA